MRHLSAGAHAGPVAALALGVALATLLAALVPRPGRPHTDPACALRAPQPAVALAAVTARAQAEPESAPLTANCPQPQHARIVGEQAPPGRLSLSVSRR